MQRKKLSMIECGLHFSTFFFKQRKAKKREKKRKRVLFFLFFLFFSSLEAGAMSNRLLAGASALAARALRASSGATASSSGSSSIGSLMPIETSTMMLPSSSSSSSFASLLWRRAFTSSRPAARYLPPVSTGGPAMLDGGASWNSKGGFNSDGMIVWLVRSSLGGSTSSSLLLLPSFSLLSLTHPFSLPPLSKNTPSTDSIPPPKPELVERILSDPSLLPREASRKLAARAAAEAARFPEDTGSPEAQVAALSQRISALANHLSDHRQDKSSSRGLQGMLARRRKLLSYLRRKNLTAYGEVLSRHSLKDRYAKLDRLGARAAATAAAPGGGKGGKKKKKKK